MTVVHLSFVIPALNEAKNIANTLSAIDEFTGSHDFVKEVIVVDHGSNDGTPDIAESMGANVLKQSGGTIGGLRNRGAKYAKGNVLVFIDADVSLTESWSAHITPVALMLVEGKKLLTGSHCAPPDSRNILLKHWFGSFAQDPRNTHLGTGHMILSKAAFNEIGGFDESLRTGEDYEFCERAKFNGFEIQSIPALKVIHHDFPKNLQNFVKREMWHGKGDLVSFSSMLNSKVVIASAIFVVLHIVILLAIIMGLSFLSFLALCALCVLLVMSSFIKNRHVGMSSIILNSGIFYFYYLGRSIALLKRLLLPS